VLSKADCARAESQMVTVHVTRGGYHFTPGFHRVPFAGDRFIEGRGVARILI